MESDGTVDYICRLLSGVCLGADEMLWELRDGGARGSTEQRGQSGKHHGDTWCRSDSPLRGIEARSVMVRATVVR